MPKKLFTPIQLPKEQPDKCENCPLIGKIPEEERGKTLMAALEEVNAKLPSAQRISRITLRETDFARTPSMKIVRYKK